MEHKKDAFAIAFGPYRGTRNSSIVRIVNDNINSTSGIKLEKCTTTPGTIPHGLHDTHADTSVAGANFLRIEFAGEECDVSSYCQGT